MLAACALSAQDECSVLPVMEQVKNKINIKIKIKIQ
jgi:hypothetical protein